MPEVIDQLVSAKPARKLAVFYVAVCVVIALGLLGGWFWNTWAVWWFDADEARSRQAAAAARLSLPVHEVVDLGDDVNLELILIPAGQFLMGSPAKEKDREGNVAQHRVMITRPFYIGKYEVTQEQWEKVMGMNPSYFKGGKNPVECVNWDDCQRFLKRLNDLGKEKGRFRLPTEAEWEWACRAGTRTRFCFGDEEGPLGDYAWYDANSGEPTPPGDYPWYSAHPGCITHPVGSKEPNAWGLYDCLGNVQEWCEDWYAEDYYAKSPRYDPAGPESGRFRVLRGGSWRYGAECCRSEYRSYSGPDHDGAFIGFRVVYRPRRK
jgi:formylglycine-generating enzyme required for sulfatase activity